MRKGGIVPRFGIVFTLFLCITPAFADPAKPLRLRNEQIHPPQPSAAMRKGPVPRKEGLILMQFAGPVQPEWRKELQSQGVKLLRYIPDDSFVARAIGADINALEALPFVTWVGDYRPEHKVHSAVKGLNRAGNQLRAIRILLSPDANPDALHQARGKMNRMERLSSTRFGHIMEGTATAEQIDVLAQSADVLWLEPAPNIKLFDEIGTKITAGDDGQAGTFAWAHQLGYDGTGVTVAVADSGLHEGDADTMHPDLAGRVSAFFHYGTLLNASDEHSHGTHVAGIVAGNAAIGETDAEGYLHGLGVAPGAEIVAQRLFDGVGAYHAPPSFEKMTRDALQAGADIGSNSWGDDTQGRYDLSAAEFDALVRDGDAVTAGDQPYILEFSAGNAGPGQQTIGSPAVAKNVIATGATENDRFDLYIYDSGSETMADFSSRGPCDDGRIKPDVVAPGTWIASLRSSLANDENAWGPISENYLYQGGTSQAGPHVSGAAALFVQYYRENITNATPSPALVKAALINSAIDIDDGASTGPIPNNDEGWGRVDVAELIDSSKRYDYLDQSITLTHGQMFERRVLVASSDEPLRITLTYTDVPGFPAAIPALVNNLDLEVIAPNGSSYHGNQFEAAESVPNAPAFDSINNVEAVHLFAPAPGEYLVRIHARNIPEDARIDTAAVDQDFALVVSADLPLPGAAVLFFDQPSYRVPATMYLKLIDFNLAGQNAVNVVVRSTTESLGENYTLIAQTTTGVFTNAIQTATGIAAADGKLQVAHGDSIEATYQDAFPAATRVAKAEADLLPPVISTVSVTNRFGRTIVTWQTDEASDSLVRFGTNSVLSRSATNARLVSSHEVGLDDLTVGQMYSFLVSSRDRAGNAATNNNNGALFTFVAQQAAIVLLVDSYTDPLFTIPPLSGYTDALDQTGIRYEVWNVETTGSPTLEDLRPFKAVIWRLPEMFGTWSPAERTTLANYLNAGGSLLVSSMEAVTRLEESGAASFRSNVLHIASYTEDVGVSEVLGVENDPATSGINVTLDYTPYEDPFKEAANIPADISDTVVPTQDAAALLLEPFGATVGVRYPRVGQDSAGRVVFLSFPLDAVPLSGTPPSTRGSLLRNLIDFLVPGVEGIGSVAFDRPAYTLPSLVAIEIADSDLIGAGAISATFHTDTAPSGKPFTLQETIRPGLFRGFISLVSDINAAGPNEVPAQNGDLIWAEYHDASSASEIRAVAVVDTDPAVITDIEVVPEYEEAIVSWSTSKTADGLVQFGESAFLNRTAYDPEPGDFHVAVLRGLQPDKTYYFKVISRDVAGNTTTDDNNGLLYSFRTSKPLSAPWSDNMENNTTNWLVLDGEAGTTTWELGTPDNGWEIAAHTGTNAWGSNLDGQAIELGDTSLISPAVSLAGGNRATLKFWHSHDFTAQSEMDIYEFGLVSISTNNGAAWTDLQYFEEFSEGWQEAEIDLTPYAGRVIRIGFYYGLFSLEASARPGWLIDDVLIAVSGATSGTVIVTNNLAQGSYSLSGPIDGIGNGWTTTFLNAPFGDYSAAYNPVPFYDTPAVANGALNSPGILLLAGTYTFQDTNTNGISDSWEQHHFGQVSPARSATTDSDGDKTSDYAEFIAGTDPNNTSDRLYLARPVQSGNQIQVAWNTVPGRTYRLHQSAELVSWIPITAWTPTSSNSLAAQVPIDPHSTTFFRVEVQP